MTTTTYPTRTPSAAESTCACGCQDAGQCTCSSEGAFIRPQFFAGQLLTEEDLLLLNQYVVEKNRLHNRYLFGEGVACGLEVVEHPCEPRKVIVNPGYALDCCGNDIVVPCPVELDIQVLI